MQLTMFTDYSLRVLIYLGHTNENATAQEIARNFKMSKNHVVKVIHRLSQEELIHTTKGRGGGLALAPSTAKLSIYEIVMKTEPNFHLVECFNLKTNRCPIAGFCDLERVLYSARAAFFDVLKKTTLEDLLNSPNRAKKMAKLRIG